MKTSLSLLFSLLLLVLCLSSCTKEDTLVEPELEVKEVESYSDSFTISMEEVDNLLIEKYGKKDFPEEEKAELVGEVLMEYSIAKYSGEEGGVTGKTTLHKYQVWAYAYAPIGSNWLVSWGYDYLKTPTWQAPISATARAVTFNDYNNRNAYWFTRAAKWGSVIGLKSGHERDCRNGTVQSRITLYPEYLQSPYPSPEFISQSGYINCTVYDQ